MEFGIFHEFPSIAGQPDAAAFDQAFELVDGAERWGLDAIWLAELHFDPARAVLSSPLCVASAIAARTRRMKIGIAVQVLPLCHPLRLAEEAATVDQLSRGRLIFGVGRSGVASTYEAYGVPYAESRDRFAEVLDIVQQAWTAETLSYRGRFHRFENVRVTPRPFQQPMPPIRVAATSPDSFVSIGKQGKPIFVAVRYETADEIAPLCSTPTAPPGARPGTPAPARCSCACPPTSPPPTAAPVPRRKPASCTSSASRRSCWRNSAKRPGVDGADRRAATAARLLAMSYDDALAGTVLVGSPDAVSDKLHGLQAQLGLDGVLMELNCGGMIPHAQVKSALRLLCREVMPRFH